MSAVAKKMVKAWPKIRTILSKEGVSSYQVDTRIQGQGKRHSFTTKVEAQSFAEQMRIKRRNEGRSAFDMSAFDRVDAESALAVLRGHGVTLKAAADFAFRHLAAITSKVPLADLVSELITNKKQDGYSKYFLQGSGGTWKRFVRAHPDILAVDVSFSVADRWLRGLQGISNDTRNGYRKDMVILFNYALARKLVADNPFKGTARAKSERGIPEILEIPQLVALLREAHHEIMPALLLGAFAGLRPYSENCRLSWEDIDFESKQIDVSKSKLQSSIRFVKMTDNLVRWLLLYRQKSGPISPSEDMYKARLTEAHRAAGFSKWPVDGLRHTFASMHYALHNNLGLTTAQMGHRGSDMLFRHYRQRVTEEMAKVYFGICPTTLNEAVLRPEMNLRDLLDEIVAAQNGPQPFGKAVIYNIKFVGGRFAAAHPQLRVSEVTFEHVEAWLDSQNANPASRKTYRYALSCLFRFARKRGYCLRVATDYDQSGPLFGVSVPEQKNNIVPLFAVA